MYRAHNLLMIQQRFSTELACQKHLAKQRWPEGFRCPRCRGSRASWIRTRKLYQCQGCRYQVSLTAGTIFHKTRVPLKKWFWMILLMGQNKHGLSILEAQRLLGIGSYETIWLMTHKIRTAMAHRDGRYKLAGLTELDESYFGGHGRYLRSWRTQKPVFVAVSRTAQGRPAFARMQVGSSASLEEARAAARGMIEPKATLKTDGSKIYPALTEEGFTHQPEVQGRPERAGQILPWMHILASNAKRFMQGTHHREAPKHLQRFLDEFTYRFNRRWFKGQLFDRLLTACVNAPSVSFAELRG